LPSFHRIEMKTKVTCYW